MRVLITGAGSSMGFDLAACLTGHERIGADADPMGRAFARRTCGHVVALPRAEEPTFVTAFERLLRKWRPQAVFPCPEAEIARLAERPDLLRAAPVPAAEAVTVALDKGRTADICRHAAALPRTARLGLEAPDFPWPRWVRSARGAGGRASMCVRNRRELDTWIAMHPDVTDWLVQEHLPGANLNVTQLWWRGRPLAVAASRRDAYVLGKAAPSGVTGEVADIVTVRRPDAVDQAYRAVRALPSRPHGFYSIDLKEDVDGRPCVTEINPRLAARPRLYALAGVNFPALWLARVAGKPANGRPCRVGVRLCRKVDMPPLVLGPEEQRGAERRMNPTCGSFKSTT